jgi:oligopeptide/dipeptide ABC transporter ATP-binding protein
MRSTPAPAERAAAPLLVLEQLSVRFAGAHGVVTAVEDLSLEVARGECLGVVGESGAGKSQAFLAVLGLAANAQVRGSARLLGTELIGASARLLDGVRGARVGMVFQDPLTSLTPHLTVGAQIEEVARRHLRLSATAARARALALLERVHVGDPARRARQLPQELSGGMRQRVMIAIALAADPQLLIADEPTTALDVTIQAQILGLLAELKRERALALVLITHDLGAVAGLADRVAVLRAGRLVECAAVAQLLSAPREPYTAALLREARGGEPPAAARASGPAAASSGPESLRVESLSVRYLVRQGAFRRRALLSAVEGVSLSLGAGGALGVVGESGSGKSSLVRALLQLLPPAAGRVVWMGQDLGTLPPRSLRALRRDLQIIFQDPLGSLDPRLTVREIVAEPLEVHAPELAAAARTAKVGAALEQVGLPAALLSRYPHQLSGGQCQRVGIARAMVLEPQLLVCDEAVSALDAPTQEQIVALLAELRRSSKLALLFVSHNLAVVRRLCERVLVMYLGRMMEQGGAEQLYLRPRHPYTRELLAAIPLIDPLLQPQRLLLARSGEPPSPLAPPSGCVYRSRCPHAVAVCAERVPAWEVSGEGSRVACHRWRELPQAADPATGAVRT